jgi:excisionase family DNA binding protein
MPPELPRLLRAHEVADQTGLSLARVYELAREGLMPCIRLGRAVRFDASRLNDWLSGGGAGQPEPPVGDS